MTIQNSFKRHRQYLVSAIIFVSLSLIAVIAAAKIPQLSTWLINASRSPANLNIDYQSRQVPLKHIWKNLAQGGESPDFNPEILQAELKQLEPEYIRIDHLYDFYIKIERNQSNQFSYDFSKLDQLLLRIRAIGATPFISLTYMPAILNGDLTGFPSSPQDYSAVVRATIEHISGKSALNFIDVYYEVWNEPDLFGQWKTYGTKNYLDLYRFAAIGASQAVNTQPYKLGGPATTKLYKNWTIGLIKHVVDNNLRLDFLSWHFYGSDPDSIRDQIDQLKNWLTPYYDLARNLEIIVSEWGIDSNNNPAYDNPTSAAHLITTISGMVPAIDKAFIFEIEDGKGPEKYWGRWGLFTHPDFGSAIKPRAQAIALLNQLGTNQIAVNGQGGWVKAIATKQSNQIDLVVANYDPLEAHSESVPLTISNLPFGEYRFEQTYLGRNPNSQTTNINTGVFFTTIPMPPNSVVHLSLTPVIH